MKHREGNASDHHAVRKLLQVPRSRLEMLRSALASVSWLTLNDGEIEILTMISVRGADRPSWRRSKCLGR